MSPTDTQARIVVIDLELERARHGLGARTQLHADLRRQQEAMGRTRTRFEHQEHADLTEALTVLVRGIAPEIGVRFDAMTPFVGKPGMAELERTIAALEAE